MLLLDDITGITQAFIKLFLMLDGVVYSLISYVFQVFVVLAQARVFKEETIGEIANRAYIVVGVAALFLVAFSLLQSLVNPDDITKGKNSPVKVIKNILISLVLLGAVPMVFNFAYEAQQVILTSHTLERLVLGGKTVGSQIVDCTKSRENYENGIEKLEYLEDEGESDENNVEAIGASMAVGMFSSFFYGEGNSGTDFYGTTIPAKYSFQLLNIQGWALGNLKNIFERAVGNEDGITLCRAFNAAQITGNFSHFLNFSDNTVATDAPSKINYTFVVSTIVGGFALYMIISYCIGLAVRAVKLGYYQIIAPVPILARIVPQGQKIFDTWLKSVLSTFAEVFIRLVTVFLVIFMVNITLRAPFETTFGNIVLKLPKGFIVPGSISNLLMFGELQNITIRVWLMARVLIILGLLIFAKKAPTFISESLGIKSGSLKLGIRDQIREAAIIGKPVATGMDKALGFLSAGAGAGWSYFKGNFGRKRPEGGSFGQAVLTGGISGAAKGGNQFAAGRDAEFKRETGKEGADSIWGEIERRSKAYTKKRNAEAREAYKHVIADTESTPEFQGKVSKIIADALNEAGVAAERSQAVKDARKDFVEAQVNAEKTRLKEDYMNTNMALEKAQNDQMIKDAMQDTRFANIRDSIVRRNKAMGINNMSMDDIMNEALRVYGETSTDANIKKRMPAALDENLLKEQLSSAFDASYDDTNIRNKAGRMFDAYKASDVEKKFNEDYLASHGEISRAAVETVSKETQELDELYKQAKGVIKDFETAENQKDFKAVIEKMMKDEKDKGGGTPPPNNNGKP